MSKSPSANKEYNIYIKTNNVIRAKGNAVDTNKAIKQLSL